MTSSNYGTNLPYYIKKGEVYSDARVKISTTSPYFLVQNADGEKVVKVEKDQAKICGWTMAEGVLHDGQVYLYAENQVDSRSIAGSNSKNDWRIIGGSNFGVDSQGNLYAENGHFRGVINSTEGNIGGWTINQNSLSANKIILNSDGSINSNGKFVVNSNGDLRAENAYISGTIESSYGHIGGWSISDGALIGGNTALYSDGTISGAYIKGSLIEADNLILEGSRLA